MKTPRPLLVVGLLLLLCVGVLAGSLRGPFVHDDVTRISANPMVHGFSNTITWLTQSASVVDPDPAHGSDGPLLYQPLVLMSFAFDWALGQGSPVAFHVTNLFFHCVACVLAYLTLHRWSGQGWPAIVGTLLFSLHPAKITGVAWISGRSEILCAVGVLMALRGASLRLGGQRRGVITEVLGTAIAFGSSDTALTLPLLVAIEAWVKGGRPSLANIAPKTLIRTTLPYAAAAILYLVFRAMVVPLSRPTPAGMNHGAVILESLGRLLVLSGWPLDLTLSAQLPTGITWAASGSLMALGLLGTLLAVAAVAVTFRKYPGLAVGSAFFLVTLIPRSNVWWTGQQNVIQPGDLYLPLLGIALLLAESVRILNRPRGVSLAVAFGLTGLLGLQAVRRVQDFSSADQFWNAELVHPESQGKALYFYAQQAIQTKRPQVALALARDALKATAPLPPSDSAQAVLLALRAAEQLIPDLEVSSLTQLAEFARNAGEQQEANLQILSPGIELHIPKGTPLSTALAQRSGQLKQLEARIQSRLGQDDAAKSAIRTLVERCPRCWPYRADAVLITARAGDFQGAEAHFEALRVGDPSETALEIRDQLLNANRAQKAMQHAPAAEQVRYETRYLAALGAWGRAFTHARPALERGARDREFGEYLAEVAFRAGDRERSQKLLQKYAKDTDPKPLWERWSLAMQWIDVPFAPDEPQAHLEGGQLRIAPSRI